MKVYDIDILLTKSIDELIDMVERFTLEELESEDRESVEYKEECEEQFK